MAQLHKRVGASVDAAYGNGKPTRLRIVGTTTMPAVGATEGSDLSLGTGALVSYQLIPATTRDAQGTEFDPSAIFVRFRPGVSRSSAVASLRRIATTLGSGAGSLGQVTLLAVQRPAEIVNYRSMGSTPALLGAALGFGAIVALGLTLVASVRSRRRDLALLKTLGFTRPAARGHGCVAINHRGRGSASSSAFRSESSPDAGFGTSSRVNCTSYRSQRSRRHDYLGRDRRPRARRTGGHDSGPPSGTDTDRGAAPLRIGGAGYGRHPMVIVVPPLLRPMSSDEYHAASRPRTRRACAARGGDGDRRRRQPAAHVDARSRRPIAGAPPQPCGPSTPRTAAASSPCPNARNSKLEAADATSAAAAPVIDVQTHLVDPTRWVGPGGAALGGFLRMADPDRWPGEIDPRIIDGAAWAALVFGASETAIALLTSTPGPAGNNVLDEPADRGRPRRRRPLRRLRPGAHPHDRASQLRPEELDAMSEWPRAPRSIRLEGLHAVRTTDAASPKGGWFLDDDEVGMPFLERVNALGPRVVAAHKGLGGPIPEQSVDAASPKDIGPAAATFPGIKFVVYHSGYERDPDGQEGPYDHAHRTRASIA